MNRPYGSVSYADLLRIPGALRTFTAATVGRLSYATVSLALLLTIHDATNSYAVAGTSVGGFAVASLTMPLKSRLIDRLSPRQVLPALAAGFAICLITISGSAYLTAAPPALYIALSVTAGVLAAPIGPSMRAAWAALTPDPAARRRAYSLDAVVEEAAFVLGPVLVVLVDVAVEPPAILVVTATLNALGTLGLMSSLATQQHGPSSKLGPLQQIRGPFRQPGFGFLVLVSLGIGFGGGPLEVALVARCQDQGHPAAVGYLLAVLSLGSVTGGLLWGRLSRTDRTRTQLGVLIALMAVGSALIAVTTNLALLIAALAAAGLVSSPAHVVAYLAADRLVPSAVRTEATTWVSTSANVGLAGGSLLGGLIIERADATHALAAGAIAYSLTSLAAVLCGQRLNPAAPHSGSARR